LEECNKADEAKQKGKKRKANLEEIDELKKQRQRLQQDINRLESLTDENAEKTECLHSIKYISHPAAKE